MLSHLGSTCHTQFNVCLHKRPMNLNSVVRLALCVALMAAPLHAADCTKKELKAHEELIHETGLLVLCGPGVASVTVSSTLLACTKPKCVEAIQQVAIEAPKCSPPLSAYRGMNMLVPFDITFRGLVRMCENEKKQNESTTSGSGSMNAVVGVEGNATATTGEDSQAPRCSPDEGITMYKLHQSSELVQACGNDSVTYSNIQEFPICSKPECMAYMKGRYMDQLPVCNEYDGSSAIGALKLTEAICQVASEPAPEPSEASITAVSSLVSFVAVAAARLIMA